MKTTLLFTVSISLIFFFAGIEGSQAATTGDSLKYLGTSFFKIKTSEGKVIYIDPYAVHEQDSADIVLITHEHSDHNDLTRVILKSTCQVIRNADAQQSGVYQNFTIGSIKISAVPAYNQYHPKSDGVGYVVEFDSIKVYHAGGTGKIPEMTNLASQNITYALLPITPGPELMTEAAALIYAKHDIPIHSNDNTLIARFTSPKRLVMLTGQTIELTHDTTCVIDPPTGVDDRPKVPIEYGLSQNYPNPFNPVTLISYQLPIARTVCLQVYDLIGREVTTLVNESKPAGSYTVQFNAARMPSSVYFYRFTTDNFSQVKRMVLIK